MMTEEQKQELIDDLQSEKLVLEKWRDDWNTRDRVNYQAIDIALTWLTQPANPALKLSDGWVAVPVEPNWEMLSADGCKEHHNGQTCLHHDNRRRIWAAMLAAAPVPHTVPIEPICATGGAEWVKVPREPTRQMMSQGHFAMAGTDRGKFRRIYQAMIAAAPEEE